MEKDQDFDPKIYRDPEQFAQFCENVRGEADAFIGELESLSGSQEMLYEALIIVIEQAHKKQQEILKDMDEALLFPPFDPGVDANAPR